MPIDLIGIQGIAGAGKDLVGKMLYNKVHAHIYHFADPIKQSVNALFGWDDRHTDGDVKEVVDP